MSGIPRATFAPIPAASAADVLPAWLRTRGRLAAALGIVFVLHVALRCWHSPTADLDESEQLIFTQAFQWGYAPQPPLYTWIQIAFFRVFGPSLFALALFKNLLLFVAYLGVYAATARMARSHTAGVLAALSMLFIPQFAWESHRDLTHSVLVTASAAVTLAVAVRLVERRSWTAYLALGLCAGVGLLSNYSFALFAVALLAGALAVRELRPVILDPRMLLSVAAAAAVLSPHVAWAVAHPEIVLGAARKARVHSEGSWWFLVGAPALRLFGAVLVHIISLVLVYLVLARRQVWPFPREQGRQPLFRWIAIAALGAPLLVLVTMLASSATMIKGRWLQPIYLLLPVVAAVWVTPRLNATTARRLIVAAGLVFVGVMVALPARGRLAGVMNRSNPINISFQHLAREIRPKVESADVILADGKFTGGNLRLMFPGKTVLTPQFAPAELAAGARRFVFVFDAVYRDEPLPAWVQFTARFSPEPLARTNIVYMDVPMRFEPGHTRRFGVAVLNR